MFEGPLGARVLREETALAPLALDDVFGFELLQVGAWGPARHLLDGARTQHATLVAPEPGPGVTLCAPLDSLPFRSDSIDAIFLPHTLELMEDPYAVLREAERVLCAEGCLMICGFNPFSGWGLRRAFARHLGRAVFPPHTRRLLSERRLRDWVAVLGFDVDSVYGYLGPLPTKGRAPRPGDGAARAGRARAAGPQHGCQAAGRVDGRAPTCSRPATSENPDSGAAAPMGAPASAGRGGRAHLQSGSPDPPVVMTHVEIFTDGACRGNPGPGGWAALLVAGKERKEVSGAEAATTNNRMELMAAIGGLGALKRRCAVKLYTDSK